MREKKKNDDIKYKWFWFSLTRRELICELTGKARPQLRSIAELEAKIATFTPLSASALVMVLPRTTSDFMVKKKQGAMLNSCFEKIQQEMSGEVLAKPTKRLRSLPRYLAGDGRLSTIVTEELTTWKSYCSLWVWSFPWSAWPWMPLLTLISQVRMTVNRRVPRRVVQQLLRLQVCILPRSY